MTYEEIKQKAIEYCHSKEEKGRNKRIRNKILNRKKCKTKL